MRVAVAVRLLPIWCVVASGIGCLLLFQAPSAHAANGDCGIPVSSGTLPKTSDCLFILRAGVGIGQCQLCVCDTNDSGSVTASDALLCLKIAVGQGQQVSCPDCTTETGACPGVVEWTTHSGDGPQCNGNADCDAGVCSAGRCRTETTLDLGWTGLGHHSDLAEGATLRLQVECDADSSPCGECSVTGIDPSDGSCRCANNWRATCDEPFAAADVNDCPACFAGAYVGNACSSNIDCDAGSCSRRCSNDAAVLCKNNGECPGGTCVATSKCSNGRSCNVNADCTGTCTTASSCQCFDGPPLPLVAATTPFCLVSLLTAQVTGTVNVDSGASSIARSVKIRNYGNASIDSPCPVCGGTCSNDGNKLCSSDAECGQGNTCSTDPVAGDGIRGGICNGGPSHGLSCDVQGTNASLPAQPDAQGGGGYSLDCTLATGSLSNGAGARVTVVESTGTSVYNSNRSCGNPFPDLSCPCRVCDTDQSVGCHTNADCLAVGGACTIENTLPGSVPNECEERNCAAAGDGRGQCASGPDDTFCDGLVKANGMGIRACASNLDCDVSVIGIDAGNCSLVQRRACFLDPIVAGGTADPNESVLAANACVGSLGSAGRNAAVGVPGPVRILRQSTLRSYCANDLNERYVPGIGGCPP